MTDLPASSSTNPDDEQARLVDFTDRVRHVRTRFLSRPWDRGEPSQIDLARAASFAEEALLLVPIIEQAVEAFLCLKDFASPSTAALARIERITQKRFLGRPIMRKKVQRAALMARRKGLSC